MDEIRDHVVDLLIQDLDTLGRTRPLTEAERDLAGTASDAERDLAGRICQARGDSARRLLAATYRNPESITRDLEVMPDADRAIYAGLPETAPEMLCLQQTRPWPPLEHARAAEITSQWTPADRALFEERFAGFWPAGFHWPD